MSDGPASPDQGIRQVSHLAREMVSRLPATPPVSSPRRAESSAMRAAVGGGGKTRASLLDLLAGDAVFMIANLTLLVDGVADCLQIASTRNNEVNYPALSATLRPTIEVAGQLAWLLDDSIDGGERGRRYLRWRFHDLRHQRLLLSELRGGDEAKAAFAELDRIGRGLLGLAASAKWSARATVVQPNGDIVAAALVDQAGEKPEPMPKITELVRTVASTPSLYGLLSVPTHGRRFGVVHGVKQDGAPDQHGKVEALVGAFGLPPHLCIGLACLAIDRPGRLLAGWNGVNASALHGAVVEATRQAGIMRA